MSSSQFDPGRVKTPTPAARVETSEEIARPRADMDRIEIPQRSNLSGCVIVSVGTRVATQRVVP